MPGEGNRGCWKVLLVAFSSHFFAIFMQVGDGDALEVSFPSLNSPWKKQL